MGTSLVARGLRSRTSTAGGTSSTPGWGTKTPQGHAVAWPKTNK